MYYFAYASNLSRKQMAERCPTSQPRFTAKLPNYKLVFTGWSRKWRGGVASIKRFSGERVYGAVYEVTDECLRRLDKYETGYSRMKVTVFDEDGAAIEATTYIHSGQLQEAMPSEEYVTLIKQGYRDWGIV